LFKNKVKFAEIPFEIQNGLFGIIALLPKAFEKEKITLLNFIDIFGIIEYMRENVYKSKLLARKISILINKWIKFFPGFSIYSSYFSLFLVISLIFL